MIDDNEFRLGAAAADDDAPTRRSKTQRMRITVLSGASAGG
jgi:hypothetical protein